MPKYNKEGDFNKEQFEKEKKDFDEMLQELESSSNNDESEKDEENPKTTNEEE